jgi:lysophospholipid acyltransferase (LPLAT)-like uncharacterized protein
VLKRILRHPSVQAALAGLVGRYLAFALRSTRWRVVGAEQVRPFVDGAPGVLALWHEVLGVVPALRYALPGAEGRRAVALASRSRDGVFIGRVLAHFSVETVHGSTSKGGAAGLMGLADALRAGAVAIITPDGPRGPRREAAPGLARLALIAGVPVVPCGAALSRHRRLPSWDRFLLPLPFGRGVICFGEPITVAREAEEVALAEVAAGMSAMIARAEAELAA